MKNLLFIRANSPFLFTIVFVCGILVLNPASSIFAYDVDNEFIPGAFPGKIKPRIFSIPVNPDYLMVVYPGSAESIAEDLRTKLARKCGHVIPFRNADELSEGDFRGKHLIVIGNIMNNRWSLELYKRRCAFADAYFPGNSGVVIHPATSLWDPDCHVLVIGVSRDEDIRMGFDTFLSLLEDGAKTIESIHHLKTSFNFPKAPEEVERIFDNVRKDINVNRVSYGLMPDWGLCYYLTGNKKWAEHFRDGMYFLHERGEKTGKWIPEPWTNVYFLFWKMVLVWDLLDEDPFFTIKDHKIIDEVLWGYFNFCRGKPIPLLEADRCLPGEMRQNHSTFMALSLFYAHRYFTGKYGISGLDDAAEKFRRCFDGQAQSYRPNDDAGGYLNYGVTHTLNYLMAEGDDSYLENGRLRDAASLTIAALDNRRDPVSLGDVGGYSHRRRDYPRGLEDRFLSMAAWYYRDSEFQWVYNWSTQDRSFRLESLYSGDYAVDIPEKPPEAFIGIHPVILDEASLRWSARRSEKSSFMPLVDKHYIDKMAFRAGFAPGDEYLLLDGISLFAHGHLDGNTVARLTWKDHIWLVDADYIKLTPQYHNGVIVVKDGIQEEPPPLTLLEYAADFDDFGFSQTTLRDFNGADWERTIVWRKGEYFLFFDTVTALSESDFRLECRWRTLGDVELSGNVMSTRQDSISFFIKSADNASRRIIDQDEVRVCLARKKMPMTAGSSWTFSNLMYVTDESENKRKDMYEAGEGLYVIDESGNRAIIGMKADVLTEHGLNTDCGLFLLDSDRLILMDALSVKFKNVLFEADSKVHVEFDYKKSTGLLLVPDEKEVTCRIRNVAVKGVISSHVGNDSFVKLAPGKYSLSFKSPACDFDGLKAACIESMHNVFPELPENARDFGFEIIKEFKTDSPVTAFAGDGNALVCGTEKGEVIRFEGGKRSELFSISPGKPIVALSACDIDDDGESEIFAGDDDETIYCYDRSGKKLWDYKMSRYFGRNADAVDITAGDIDNSGENTLLVSTNGWKLYAFEPDGTVKWESFVFYHPLTKVRILKNRNKTYIAVGTIYSTPLNVVNPDDGKVNWFTWEQVGDEFLSTTEYCGIHLTDMVFLDTDNNGEKEIVFGTKYNRVYAIDAADGSTHWEANVGDEVTVMKDILDYGTGEKRIVTATGAGDLVMLDSSGRRLNTISFQSPISDMEILAFPEYDRNDIIVSTADGRVVVCDDDFLIRASLTRDGIPLKGIVIGGKESGDNLLYCVSDDRVYILKYNPFFQRKSRHF